jgi:hypothetical protein
VGHEGRESEEYVWLASAHSKQGESSIFVHSRHKTNLFINVNLRCLGENSGSFAVIGYKFIGVVSTETEI